MNSEHHEIIVVGAGVAGIYQIKRLIDLGVDAIVIEADEDLGGTWYRNRYPGCRFDSESYTYGYSFSRELLDEWDWKELFSSQPENLKYLNFVAEKFDLRQHMRFNSRVDRMVWDEENRIWNLTLKDGMKYSSKFIVSGMGVLSIPTLPNYDGMDKFKGESFHTYYWPQEGVSLEGKRVGIVGTGATGIQVISAIADEVAELKVFQRRPNWSSPLNNAKISKEKMQEIRSRYDEIFQLCATSPGAFIHTVDRRGFDNLSPEERRLFWDQLYNTPGFALLAANFAEIYLDEEANKELSEYVASRIRGRVNDPLVAEKLIPKDHGYGMQRIPLETNYFEAYNNSHVELVDVSETPITRVTESGLKTSERHYELDIIVYATGFDAVTGAFDQIEIVGQNGQLLRDKWKEGPKTYIGLMTTGFPNFIMIAGPQSASGAANFPRTIETSVDWISNLITYARKTGVTRIEPKLGAEAAWNREVIRMHEKMLFRRSKSWFTGYVPNVQGEASSDYNPNVRYVAYWGGAPKFKTALNQAEAENYPGLMMETDDIEEDVSA